MRKTNSQYARDREVRLCIIAELYRKGHSYRDIQKEVKKRLDLKTYSLSTLSKDVNAMLSEWRTSRVETVDDNLTLELARIDKMLVELWNAWERSKAPKQSKSKTQAGRPGKKGDGEAKGDDIIPVGLYQTTSEATQTGDPRYMELIHKTLQERRKLLGIYKEAEQSINIHSAGEPIGGLVIGFKKPEND